MSVLVFLVPVSLLLGGVGLIAFFWALRHNQFDDPKGDAARILDDPPPPPPPPQPPES